jgi:hypothetical protein
LQITLAGRVLIQRDPLYLIGGPEPFVQFAPVAQILQFDLCERAALAGLDVVAFDSDPKALVMLQHVTGADFVSVNLGHGSSLSKMWRQLDRVMADPISGGRLHRKPTKYALNWNQAMRLMHGCHSKSEPPNRFGTGIKPGLPKPQEQKEPRTEDERFH